MSGNNNSQVFLGRQPILGRNQQLLAYELLFREGPLAPGNRVNIVDASKATATVIANAFTGLGLHDTLGPYQSYINVDQEFLFSELIEALPTSAVVLEILESVSPTAEVIERCRQLHEMGFTLAIDDLVKVDEAYRPLLEIADIIKVDVLGMAPDQLTELVGQLRPFGKKLLAEKVESSDQAKLCKKLGFELFQGYYFAKPTIVVGRKLSPSQVELLRLLSLVLQDAETSEIEDAFKAEPRLTVNMLRLTNSVSSGLSARVTSLRHAITILGRRQLQRWLQLLIYTDPKGAPKTDDPLLQLAATRGRLMELLAERQMPKDREFADHGFMAGIISLMPTLLGVPIEEILEQLPIVPRVKEALTERKGLLGRLLQLAEATEQAESSALDEALSLLPAISLDFLEDSLAQALYWANNLGKEKYST